jgi:GTPase SAR1 family protein
MGILEKCAAPPESARSVCCFAALLLPPPRLPAAHSPPPHPFKNKNRIKEIEAEMARTQRNKATEYHLGQLKARLAKLRTELQAPSSKGGAGEGFDVQKYGDGRVALIGFPSVGKSSLLTLLTGTASEAAAYEFTTLTCIPGVRCFFWGGGRLCKRRRRQPRFKPSQSQLRPRNNQPTHNQPSIQSQPSIQTKNKQKKVIHYNDAKIQLLDLPGIIEGAAEGKGRGRQVIAVCKSADLLLMVLDATKPWGHRDILTRELEAVGMRLNKCAFVWPSTCPACLFAVACALLSTALWHHPFPISATTRALPDPTNNQKGRRPTSTLRSARPAACRSTRRCR